MANTNSLDRSLANPVTEYLASNEDRLGRIEGKLTELITKLNKISPSSDQITDLHQANPEKKKGEQSLDLPYSTIEKIKPTAERLLAFLKSLLGQANSSEAKENFDHKSVDISDIAQTITEFNKQNKTDEYMDFLEDNNYNPDEYSVFMSIVPDLISHFVDGQPNKLEPGSPAAKLFMKNIFTVFLSGKLEDDVLDINPDDEEIKQWLNDLECYFQSNTQSFGEKITENLGEEGFSAYAGILIYLTYISAYKLADEEGIEVKYALDTRFNQLKLLCDKYELMNHGGHDMSIDLQEEAIKMVDEFLETNEANLDDYKANETHLHELITSGPMDLIEEMVDALKGSNLNGFTSDDDDDYKSQFVNFDKEFTHLIRQSLAVLTANNISVAKATELYDWLLDESASVKEEKNKLMTEVRELWKDNPRFEKYAVKVLNDNFEKALVLVLYESLNITGDLVIGFDQDKLAIVEKFKP